jgi:hypothetical protein
MTKAKNRQPFSMYVDVPSKELIGAQAARQLLKDAAARDRIEKIAARCIDASISKIVSDKATPVLNRAVSDAIPNQFDFPRFVHEKVKEWGSGEILKVIEQLIAREHRKATLAVTEEMRQLVKAKLKETKSRKPSATSSRSRKTPKKR